MGLKGKIRGRDFHITVLAQRQRNFPLGFESCHHELFLSLNSMNTWYCIDMTMLTKYIPIRIILHCYEWLEDTKRFYYPRGWIPFRVNILELETFRYDVWRITYYGQRNMKTYLLGTNAFMKPIITWSWWCGTTTTLGGMSHGGCLSDCKGSTTFSSGCFSSSHFYRWCLKQKCRY